MNNEGIFQQPITKHQDALLLLFPSVNLDDPVLVNVLENVRGIHQNTDSAGRGNYEEHVQLQSVNHHRHVLPVLPRLRTREIITSTSLSLITHTTNIKQHKAYKYTAKSGQI